MTVPTPTRHQAEAARAEFAALGVREVRAHALTPDQRRSLYAEIERHGALVHRCLFDIGTCRVDVVASRLEIATFHLKVAWSIYRRLLTSPAEAA